MKLTTPRAQIALEFLLVFSFVLLVFIFIFALITSQRSLGMSYQSFSQLQLVAQSVAMAMSNAATAGNGYTVQLPISSTIGMLPYNLTVTKSGIVVASMRVGEQLVQARAYSAAKSVISSQSFAKSATSYQLPLQNGTISIQSYYGEVCVDYNCQSQKASMPQYISLYAQNVHAANFNGQTGSSYIVTPALSQLNGATGASFSAWFYLSSLNVNEILLSDDWGSPSIIQVYIHTNGQLEADYGNGGWIVAAETPAGAISAGKWYFVSSTYLSGSGEKIFINGVSQPLSYIVGSATSTGTLASGGTGDIAYNQGNGGAFAGMIANMQIYNTTLSQSQIQQLYQEGISAPPIANAGLVAWWPLDGNSNDYSGNGNNGTLYGSASFVAPGVGNYDGYQSSILAAEFNGANSMIITPISFNTPSFAAVLWVNGASTSKMTSGNGYTIFNSIGANNFQMWLNNGGSLGAPVGSGDEEIGFGTNLYHGYGINGSSWNMLAVSVSSGKASLYANGAGPYNLTIPTGPYSLNALAIGQSAAGISQFAGGIANVQLYNQTLTPSQVSQLYGEGISGIPISGQKMIAWWPLDGNSND